ncbi:D-2-hydroxyacid dehydrogenase [Betaproteobacteria bacterium]|nr:D-2-hydroxyacid dehydrogenase [Betaproteobacteria bacterium]GHU02056.1 D-2-hydroxyacid dehydrogenase [Betaproteobacteria bacterium]
MSSDLLARLAALIGPTRVLTNPDETAPYLTDHRGHYTGRALAVAKPDTTAEVAAIVAACREAGVAMVPQGGNTSLCGGATPLADGGALLISLSRLNRVRALDTANDTLCVEAGCTLAAVQEAAAAAGRLFPLSLASGGSCEVGGNLSTNAGGVQVLRYGNMRELTLGLEVVLPDGRVWNGLRGLRKDNTGYDLKQLFIGAEGTLGIITAAVLKLFPAPATTASAWLAVADPAAAVALLARFRAACGERVTAFELVGRPLLELVLKHMPRCRDPLPAPAAWSVLVELSDSDPAAPLTHLLEQTLGAAIEAGEVADAAIATTLAQREHLWALRENANEAQKREGYSFKHDISLPVSRIAEFMRRSFAALHAWQPELRIVAFGHIGDGNLHYNLFPPPRLDTATRAMWSAEVNRIVYDLVDELDGSISAEHGLGQLKREEIRRYKAAIELELMGTIKRAFDPLGLMNPGKVL